MARFTIPAERFPHALVPIRTRAGLVEFSGHVFETDDEDLAAALREVPAVFGITEDDPPEPSRDGEAERPSTRAPKAEWVAYAEKAHDTPASEAEAMTKAELIEKFGG
ncbi:hypothetical protein AB0C69_11010 [Actinomadura sp. NPDC048032]|uniref:hypothetical protein n=1 Tax=Actinomadura sp. NPDC048032 TaxID=3155747 RepID=UPI0033F30EAB